MANMCFPWLEVPDHAYLEDMVINNFINVMLSANLNFPDSSSKLRKLFDSFICDQQASASYEVQVKHLRDMVGVASTAGAESNGNFPHPDDEQEVFGQTKDDPACDNPDTSYTFCAAVTKAFEAYKKICVPYSALQDPCDGLNRSKNIAPDSFSTTLTPTAAEEKSIDVHAAADAVTPEPSQASTKLGPDIVEKACDEYLSVIQSGSEQKEVLPKPSEPSESERPIPLPRRTQFIAAPAPRRNFSSAPTVFPPLTSEQQILPPKTFNSFTESSTICVHPSSTSPTVFPPLTSEQQLFPSKTMDTESSTICAHPSPISIPASASSRKSRFTGIAAREKLQQQMLNATK